MELKAHIFDEKTGISYTLHGDYYLPDLMLPEENETRFVGKYGRLHNQYLKQNQKGTYISLLTSGKLHSYLADVEEQAQDKMELLINQMAKAQGVTEKLKAEDQMAWVGAMNNIRSCAEEIIFKELVYAYGNTNHAMEHYCAGEKARRERHKDGRRFPVEITEES